MENLHILSKSASPLDRDEVKLGLMLVNRNNDRFSLISGIILPKVLTQCYPIYIETMAVIYWN